MANHPIIFGGLVTLLVQELPLRIILSALLLAVLFRYSETAEGTPSVKRTIEFRRLSAPFANQILPVRLLQLHVGDPERFGHARAAAGVDGADLVQHVAVSSVHEAGVRPSGGGRGGGGIPGADSRIADNRAAVEHDQPQLVGSLGELLDEALRIAHHIGDDGAARAVRVFMEPERSITTTMRESRRTEVALAATVALGCPKMREKSSGTSTVAFT